MHSPSYYESSTDCSRAFYQLESNLSAVVIGIVFSNDILSCNAFYTKLANGAIYFYMPMYVTWGTRPTQGTTWYGNHLPSWFLSCHQGHTFVFQNKFTALSNPLVIFCFVHVIDLMFINLAYTICQPLCILAMAHGSFLRSWLSVVPLSLLVSWLCWQPDKDSKQIWLSSHISCG